MNRVLHVFSALILCFVASACAAGGGPSGGVAGGGFAVPGQDTAGGDGGTQQGDAALDAACTPQCGANECGDNGCGGSCGSCPAAAPLCVAGACQPVCQPQCANKQCGDNGCGGTCGSCPSSAPDCVANMCTAPAAAHYCNANCGKGVKDVCFCDGECAQYGDCCNADGTGKGGKVCSGSTCGECNGGASAMCGDGNCDPGETSQTCAQDCKSGCVPNCDGTKCGSDGCNGTCSCAGGLVCAAGACKAPAATHYCNANCGKGVKDVCFCDGECAQFGDCCNADGTGKGGKVCSGSTCGDCNGGAGASCGDGKCDPGETAQTCAQDCKSTCVPQCDGTKCGSDGCNGTCSCPGGLVCAAGTCTPPSAKAPTLTIDPVGLLPIGGTKALPGWLSHLYGKKLVDVGQFDLLDIELGNSDSVAHTFNVEVEIPGYSEVYTVTANVSAKSAWTKGVGALTWKPAWKSLGGPASTQLQVRVMEAGKVVAAESENLALYPVNYVSWGDYAKGGGILKGEETVVTLITPGDKDVVGVVSAAKNYSVFGSMLGYQYKGAVWGGSKLPAKYVDLAPGKTATWATWYDVGDKADTNVSVTCGACWDYNAQYFLYDGDGTPLFGWSSLGNGFKEFTIQTAGWYYHVATNPVSNSSNRQFTIKRAMAVNEGAQDQVGAVFEYLQVQGLGYITVSGSYFSSGAQYVKKPSESINTSGANCIDGALLIAAALEAMGMEAVLAFPPGHALVGVRCWPGSNCVVPLETTMIGDGSTVQEAVNAGGNAFGNAQGFTDVVAQRKKGFTPIP